MCLGLRNPVLSMPIHIRSHILIEQSSILLKAVWLLYAALVVRVTLEHDAR